MEKMSTLTFPDGSQYEVVDAAARAQASVNAEDITELNQKINKVKTYVGSDGKLHFTDASGADSVLPFSSGLSKAYSSTSKTSSKSYTITADGTYTIIAVGSKTWMTVDTLEISGFTADISQFSTNDGSSPHAIKVGLNKKLTKGTVIKASGCDHISLIVLKH